MHLATDNGFDILTNINFVATIKSTYKECVRDKLVDRTPTCRKERW